ncbi:MAG: hypothetical protein A3K67_01715 [Euryarchaeota archaeon RBG_16_62_10]|nr:MAG: hypothetical protein A3K67_01715 [Euryarchaeota archaeon RBG_16_62_10]
MNTELPIIAPSMPTTNPTSHPPSAAPKANPSSPPITAPMKDITCFQIRRPANARKRPTKSSTSAIRVSASPYPSRSGVYGPP